MSSEGCVVPGSYDPVTLGHLDIIRRAAGIFPVVHVALLDNTSKKYAFSGQERLEMLQGAVHGLRHVKVCRWEGLLVDLLRSLGLRTVVRGLRDANDFAAERQLALANARLLPDTETLWLGSSPEYMGVSSTVVRELIRFGADISTFVPPSVIGFISARTSAG